MEDLSLTIAAGSVIALIGATGAGKSTIVDLLLGLLEPQSGAVRIDGIELDQGRRAAWGRSIGHVPQDVFLVNDTIAANIAFGEQTIDRTALTGAARAARLESFVATLPQGFETLVGDQGIRLSGGEKQRIGIARALYRDPDLLIFDEATSALDTVTEAAVMEALEALRGRKTLVIVAHRLDLVRRCDLIALVEGGRIAALGSYDVLMARDERFRAFEDARHYRARARPRVDGASGLMPGPPAH